MLQYFSVLLIFCLSEGSLRTTISPQQQDTAKLKEQCQKFILGQGFPGIPGTNGMPGMPGVPGPQGPQGREGAKGQTGDKGSQGMPGSRGNRGREGSPGKSGPRGIMGMKGEPGLVGKKGETGVKGKRGDSGIAGNMGRKGVKGEKGESAKASQASVVPQTNWKQCVWKSATHTDNGKIKDCTFKKLRSDTALKVSYQGNTRMYSSGKCSRWYFKFNGNECTGPMTIEAAVYSHWPSGTPNLHRHQSLEGYCENIPNGVVSAELWVGQCGSWPLGDAYTGWDFISRIMIKVSGPQN